LRKSRWIPACAEMTRGRRGSHARLPRLKMPQFLRRQRPHKPNKPDAPHTFTA
jgi:hypothetical protein